MCAGNVSALSNLTDGLTHSERLLTVMVTEEKPSQKTATTVLTAWKRVCTVRLCVFACVSVCVWSPSMQTELCIKSGIYVKVLIFSSHFLLMFKITVSRQEFFNSMGKWSGGEKEKHKLPLQRQTHIITTPFVLMFSLSPDHSCLDTIFLSLSFIIVKHYRAYLSHC